MTDTGQIPGEGQPENAGGQPETQQQGIQAAGHGPYTYPEEAYGAGVGTGVAPGEEELLLPGGQGAWAEGQAGVLQQGQYVQPDVYAQPDAYGRPDAYGQADAYGQEYAHAQQDAYGHQVAYVQQEQAQPQPGQPQAVPDPQQYAPEAAQHVPGPHELDGRDSGAIDVGAVRATVPEGQAAHAPAPVPAASQAAAAQPAPEPAPAPAPQRRPLHLGPPEPEQSGAVRPLSDRGLRKHAAGPAPARSRAHARKPAHAQHSATDTAPEPAPASPQPEAVQQTPAQAEDITPQGEFTPEQGPATNGPEYLDAAGQGQQEYQGAEDLPGPQLGALPPQNDQWASQTQQDPQQHQVPQTEAAGPAQESAYLAGPQLVPPAEEPGTSEVPSPARESGKAAVAHEPQPYEEPSPAQPQEQSVTGEVPPSAGDGHGSSESTGNTWVSAPGSSEVEAIEPQGQDVAQPDAAATGQAESAAPLPDAAEVTDIQEQQHPEPAVIEDATQTEAGNAVPAGPAQEQPETAEQTAAEQAAEEQDPAGAEVPATPQTSGTTEAAAGGIPAQQQPVEVPDGEVAAPEPEAVVTVPRQGQHAGPAEAEPAQEAIAEPTATEPPAVPVAETAAESVAAETAGESVPVETAEEASAGTAAVDEAASPAVPGDEAGTEAVVTEPASTEAAGTEVAAPASPISDDGTGDAASPSPDGGEAADSDAVAPEAVASDAMAPEAVAPGEETDDGTSREAAPEDAAGTADAAETPVGPPAPGFADDERDAVHRLMRERRDIRNGFRPDPIPHEVLLRVLEAAHTAPSVGHSQPWDFVVIRSEETRRAMHELAERQRDAYAESLPKGRAKQFKELKIEAILDTPINIVVTADPTRGGRHTLGRHTQPQMAPYSSALAVENLWLAARAEGLGVGWVSFFDEREMVRALELPEHLEVVAYLCVGYVDEFPPEPELAQAGWSKRRPLSWVVHEESYGRRVLPGAEPQDLLSDTVAAIRPLDAKALGEAWERQKRMTKPSGALGMLEIISAQLCGLSRKCPPPLPEPAAVAVFAGDHGVHAQGVTPWPQEVTAQMVANFLGGGAVCNAFANQVGAEVCVVDVGVAGELPPTPGLLPRKVRAGTADMTQGPALTREEALRAVEVGIETARDLVAAGNKALLTGEMGIANTTVSAALISACTGVDPAEVTGRGTGISDETHARKVEVVRRALEVHQPDTSDPLGLLASVGGLEHAALVGLILGGASLRTPVILDGVSAGAAALVARCIAPEAMAACIAGHRSSEPGHVAALNKLGLRPLVDLDLRLGEGTGALLSLPMVQSAARAMHDVATFDSAGVTGKS